MPKPTKSNPAKSGDTGLDALLANPAMVRKFGLEHVSDSYGKKGRAYTTNICIVHIIRTLLNKIGINGTTTVADIKAYVAKYLGSVPAHVDKWLEQQAGSRSIGGISIKNPKITLSASGKIRVLKLHESR
jgi:hypothetical protein